MKMKNIFFLLFLNLSFSAIAYLPAVSESGDSFLSFANISIQSSNSSEFLFSVKPFMGLSAQKSFYTAVTLAFQKANKSMNKTQVQISLGNLSTEYVDGPSGGLSVALSTYFSLINSSIPNQYFITGAIDSNGNVYPVGGIYEKTLAGLRAGKSKFIIPKESVYDIIPLFMFFNTTNITFIQVNSLDQAIEIIKQNRTTHFNPKPENISIYNLSNISLYPPGFKQIAFNTYNESKDKINTMLSTSKRLSVFIPFFNQEFENQKTLIEKGYLYSGANNMFLMSVNVVSPLLQDSEILAMRDRLNECISSLDFSILQNTNNFEMWAGAYVRKQWAQDKLPIDQKMTFNSDRIQAIRDLSYGLSWCKLSHELLDLAKKTKGEEFYVSSAKDEANNLIKDLSNNFLLSTNPIAFEHFVNSRKLYSKGIYTAAIFEASFSKALISEQIPTNQSFSNLSSFWAKVYFPHAVFLKAKNDSANVQIFALSYFLDTSFKNVLNKNKELMLQNKYGSFSRFFSNDFSQSFEFKIFIVDFLILVLFFILYLICRFY